jgi:hypothetical protein
MDWIQRKSATIRREGNSEGKTERVSSELSGGKSFAAKFAATRVKPGWRERKRKRMALRNAQGYGLGKTEPRSRAEPKRGASRGNSPETARVKPNGLRVNGDEKQQLRESKNLPVRSRLGDWPEEVTRRATRPEKTVLVGLIGRARG